MIDEMQQQRFFVQELLQWFKANKRDLPWRRTQNPYHIWVSEIMLQQTRVDTVIPFYERFISLFPTVQALAEASEEEVLKAWEGLGYYSRARNLQHAVREVHEQYGGIVPNDPQQFSSLKGVGPYTKGAVLSIAYNLPEPAVDGNVMRVLSRFFCIEDDVMKSSTRSEMEQLVREIIPRNEAGDFNQALMELGALVCTPKSPQCLTCPVREHCMAHWQGKEEQLPVKKKAKAPRIEYRTAAFIKVKHGCSQQWLMRQRPQQGLLARMWELPHIETTPPGDAAFSADMEMERLKEYIWKETGLFIEPQGFVMELDHIFSHLRWMMKVYEFTVSESELEKAEASATHLYRWIHSDALQTLALPNIFVRVMASLSSK